MGRVLLTVLLVIVVALAGLIFWLWTPDLSRDHLEERYFGLDSLYVDVDGARLHVRDTGPRDAPALLMLHGLGSSLHTWQNWAEALQDTYRVIRLDLPGHGLTGADPSGNYSTARTLDLIDGVLDARGIDTIALIGNSMGGRIAWNYAASRPARTSALVLIAPDGFESPGFSYGQPPEMPAALGLMRFTLPAFMLRPNVVAAYADPDALTKEVFDRYHDMMRAPGTRGAMVDLMGQVVLQPPEPLLSQITAPVLLVWGTRDAMIPVENAQDYLAALPDGRLVALETLGHVPHEEAPDTSLVPVRAFLDEVLGP